MLPSWSVSKSQFVDMICVIEKMCRLWLVCKLAKSLLLGDD